MLSISNTAPPMNQAQPPPQNLDPQTLWPSADLDGIFCDHDHCEAYARTDRWAALSILWQNPRLFDVPASIVQSVITSIYLITVTPVVLLVGGPILVAAVVCTLLLGFAIAAAPYVLIVLTALVVLPLACLLAPVLVPAAILDAMGA